jgi:ArsR family transcriptional regulator
METAIPLINDGDSSQGMDELAALCKALAHPARIRILRHLLEEDRCICGSIVKVLPLAQSTVSQHLKILKEAGLVRGTVEGPAICYCVDRNRLASVGKTMATIFNWKDDHENEK